ncbi:MAG: hypothetical protein WDZ82_03270 [Candidatus Paceibacterota bacterium]
MRTTILTTLAILSFSFVSFVSPAPAEANDIKDWFGDDIGEKVADVILDDIEEERDHKRDKDREEQDHEHDLERDTVRTRNRGNLDTVRTSNDIRADNAGADNNIREDNNTSDIISRQSRQEHNQNLEFMYAEEHVAQPGESEAGGAIGERDAAKFRAQGQAYTVTRQRLESARVPVRDDTRRVESQRIPSGSSSSDRYTSEADALKERDQPGERIEVVGGPNQTIHDRGFEWTTSE